MAYQRIPVTSEPNQIFQTVLLIGEENRSLKFNFVWNYTGKYWVMRITDPSTEEILIDSVPLVTGVINTDTLNILRKHGYLGIGSAFLVPIVEKPSDDFPSDITLGKEFDLIWGDVDD